MDLEESEDEASKRIIEFLEVAIHIIIYSRQIYPSSTFASKQKYGTPIRISTCPAVSGYITKCLKGIHELFNKNEIHSVHLVLVKDNSDPIESFVFDFSNASSSLSLDDSMLKKSIQQFQMFCLKLGTSEKHINPSVLRPNFRLQIVTTTSTWASTLQNLGNNDFPWCAVTRPLEKSDPLAATISPTESFSTTFLSVRNICYDTSTAGLT